MTASTFREPAPESAFCTFVCPHSEGLRRAITTVPDPAVWGRLGAIGGLHIMGDSSALRDTDWPATRAVVLSR
jgi:hypothetical protein